MSDPLTTTAALGLTGFLLGKTGDAAWSAAVEALLQRLRPDLLSKKISAALESDPGLARVYDSPPSVDSERLTAERVRQIIQLSLSSDEAGLGEYLMSEQVIDLPHSIKAVQESFDPIWKVIASCVRAAVEAAVAADPEFARRHQLALGRFQAFSEEQAGQRHAELFSSVESLHTRLDTIEATPAISDRAAARTISVLAEHSESLEQQLRERLDAQTEQLWEEVLGTIREHNFGAAIAHAAELTSWVTENAAQLSSDVRGRALLLLAQAALIESADTDTVLSRPRDLLQQAKDAFGPATSSENLARINSFEAKLDAMGGQYEAALARLATAKDPSSIAARLAIAIDSDDMNALASAAALVREIPLDENWCEHAIYAHVRTGDMSEADRVLAWALSNANGTAQLSCRVAYVRAAFARIADSDADRSCSPLEITTEQRMVIGAALTQIAPVAEACLPEPRIASGLQAEAIECAYACLRILGRVHEARRFIGVLSDYRPARLEFARAVLRDDTIGPDRLADSLRQDHPLSFQAHDIALSLDAVEGKDAAQLVTSARQMIPLARSDDDRERVAERFVQIAAVGPPELFEQVRAALLELVGEQHRLYRLLLAENHLKSENLDACEALLAAFTPGDDVLADQFRAYLLLSRGLQAEAAMAFLAVGERMAEPDILKRASQLAFSTRPCRLDIAIRALEKALVLVPDDVGCLEMLATAYAQRKGHAQASKLLRRLRNLKPERDEYALGEAQCMIMSHRPEEALAILQELCARSDAPLQAHLLRAVLLANIGRPEEAFFRMESVQERYWDEPFFVMLYMKTAYAANEDWKAHGAFVQLRELQAAGKATPDVLQPKSIEDVIELREQDERRRKRLHEEVTGGRLPWTFADQVLGHVPYLGWRMRTQSLPWFSDEPVERASFSIYATNGYTIATNKGGPQLRRIECPPAGTPVVIDLSAMITLHRLGLVRDAFDFFGHIKVPASYLTQVAEESGQLQPHQKSRVLELRALNRALAVERITLDQESGTDEPRSVVDEYSDVGTHYRIDDVLRVLDANGYLGLSHKEQIARQRWNPAVGGDSLPPLRPDEPVVIELMTLRRLAQIKLLDPVCDAFDDVRLSSVCWNRLVRELDAFDVVTETRQWHEELWRILREDDRVDKHALLLSAPLPAGTRSSNAAEDRTIAPAEAAGQNASAENREHSADQTLCNGRHEDGQEPDGQDEEVDEDTAISIEAALLARQEGLPLMADDRSCQSMLLTAEGKRVDAAFGTDRLIDSLQIAGWIDPRRAATAFLRLAKWRYRFLIPSTAILRTVVEEFPPRDRRLLFAYAHDCMRDVGLYGGPEPTDPPVPMAVMFHHGWVRVIATYLAELWLSDCSEDHAATITREAISEWLPAAPRVLGAAAVRIAETLPRTVIVHASAALAMKGRGNRANACLQTIASALGLEEDEYSRIIADMISAQ